MLFSNRKSRSRRYRFFIIGAIYCVGVVLASKVFIDIPLIISLFVLSGIGLFVTRNKDTIASIFLFFIVIEAGMFSYMTYNNIPKQCIVHFLDNTQEKVVIVGKIINDPVFFRDRFFQPKQDLLVEAFQIDKGKGFQRVSGQIKGTFYVDGSTVLKYGQTIAFTAKISLPRNYSRSKDFDYRKYLLNKKIYGVFKIGSSDSLKVLSQSSSWFDRIKIQTFRVKDVFREYVQIYIEPPYSDMIIAMMIGDRQGLPKNIKQVFIDTGTMHVLAISGLHVGIICLVLFGFLKMIRIPYKGRLFLVLVLICFYALMVGQRASVWRASIMSSLVLLGLLFDKRAHIVHVLGLAFLMMLVICPNYIFDIGFIMSFVCVLFIIMCAPLFFALGSRYFLKGGQVQSNVRKIGVAFWDSFSVSMSAWLGVMPVCLYFFHSITPLSVLINLIAVPLCFVIVSSGVLFFIGIFWIRPLILLTAGFLQLMSALLLKILEISSFSGEGNIVVPEQISRYAAVFYVFYFFIIWKIKSRLQKK